MYFLLYYLVGTHGRFSSNNSQESPRVANAYLTFPMVVEEDRRVLLHVPLH